MNTCISCEFPSGWFAFQIPAFFNFFAIVSLNNAPNQKMIMMFAVVEVKCIQSTNCGKEISLCELHYTR